VKTATPGVSRRALRDFATLAAVGGRVSAGYTGAGTVDRALREWDYVRGSADQASAADLPEMRERSSDLVRNEPLAAGWLQTERDCVVGTGLRPQSIPNHVVLGITLEAAKEAARQFEAIFDLVKDQLDIERSLPFAQQQELALMSPLERGDVLVIRRWEKRPGDVLGLKVQMVEADRVSNPNNLYDTDELRQGVKKDRHGAPEGYYVASRHPYDYMSRGPVEWTYVPAFGPLTGEPLAALNFRRMRLGQTRGIPALAPVIGHFKKLGRYTDAEIVGALVNAMLAVFITRAEGSTAPALTAETDDATLASDEYRLESGSITELAPGDTVTTVNAARPNQAFGPFVDSVLMQTSTALGLPVEVFTKRFLASYSAARAALLEAWRHFYGWREWLSVSFCRLVWGWVISEAVSAGLVDAPGFFDSPLIRNAWLRQEWIGDAPGQIDELKEVKAAQIRVSEGFSTVREETAGITGGDWERNHAQRTEEVRRRRADGLQDPAADAEGDRLIEDGDRQEAAAHGD
jgi:lambda family phage portal protein